MNDFIINNLKKLKKNKIPNPEIDLKILLNYSSHLKKEIIFSNFDINQINVKVFNTILNRRIANEPISKIINKKSFWKDDFYVNEFVLDPRPETEGIIDDNFDLIVSNPPYLSKKEMKNISYEIRNFEPLIALDGGEDGLDFYRQFAKKIILKLKTNGYLIIEIGAEQYNDCIQIFSVSGLKFEKKSQDLQKKDRIMVFSKL